MKPKAISLFTGAGGLDYGFEAAGFNTNVAVEFDHQCCETLRHNRDWVILEEDIHAVSTRKLLRAAGLRPGEPDVLIGGPPCQPFSKAGFWSSGDTSRLDDPRAATLGAFMRVVREAKPRAFLLENVAGLSYEGKREALEFLLRSVAELNRCKGLNYRVSHQLMQAADYGIPQLRERFFLVASRDGKEFRFPPPTHSRVRDSSKLEVYRTAWDALWDLPDDLSEELRLRGKWAALVPSIPEGRNYLHHTERGNGLSLFGWRRRYWSFLLKLAKNKPSWTIQAKPGPAIGPLHWKNRRLNARELCRLQTFPDDVEIMGSIGAVQKQLGNAVPSLLAEILAREIRTQLLGGRRRTGLPTLVLKRQSPVPRATRARRVPDKYLPLVGKHLAHPGTGQGYSASVGYV